ncbi:MAG: hypothetical protein LC633_00260, partial [Desulfobulbaceae bacterium]|nr:hypothetical protein [Desulfobulbaceae bacterium]
TLSGSQDLPAFDDADINFDDTVAADFAVHDATEQTSIDFDDSIEINEDDLSLELGDIMPIDLDQLDQPGLPDEDFDADSTQIFSADFKDEEISLDEIDLDLGDDFGADASSEFDATEILNTDKTDEDIINFDLTGEFDNNIDFDLSGDLQELELDDTTIFSPADPGFGQEETPGGEPDDSFDDAFLLDEEAPSAVTDNLSFDSDQTEYLELEDDMLEEFEPANEDQDKIEEILSGTGPAADFAPDYPGGTEEFQVDVTQTDSDNLGFALDEEVVTSQTSDSFSQTEEGIASGISELDDPLLDADDGLNGQSGAPSSDDFESGLESPRFDLGPDLDDANDSVPEDAERLGDELLATLDEEMDFDVAELENDREETWSASGESAGEDLDDELLAVMDDDAEAVSPPLSLGLEDIDVSDLVSSSSPDDDPSRPPDSADELDLTSLMEDDETKDVGLDHSNEDIPESRLVEDDNK